MSGISIGQDFEDNSMRISEVQAVRWDKGINEPTNMFLYVKWTANHHLRTGCLVHKGIRSSYKRVEFLNVRMYIIFTEIKIVGVQMILFRMYIPQLMIEMMIQKELLMRNQKVYLFHKY